LYTKTETAGIGDYAHWDFSVLFEAKSSFLIKVKVKIEL
jgi:hypothetical protein